jgi:hypothetical protein
MNIEQILAAHERETDALIAEIKAYRARPREACDYMIYDGLAVQIRMLENLGLRLYAVEELQSELKKLSAEIFRQ